jgi:hypothetical protein
METQRCPLCYIRAEYGVIDHLRRDHRRSEIEARTLVERSREGSLGWNAESWRERQRPSLPPTRPLPPRESR